MLLGSKSHTAGNTRRSTVSDKTKKEAQHGATFASGKTPMHKQQAADTDRPGNTGKDQTAAPGARHAERGSTMFTLGGVS
jgi:hypothetical protein